MNHVNIGNSTLTITDPETGEKHTLAVSDVRAMVAGIAKDIPELGEAPPELRGLIDIPEREPTPKPQVLEVGAAPKSQVKGLVPLNRKDRRKLEKQRRSKVYQKAEAKRLESVRKQMQANIDAQRKAREEAEALQDVPFADPRHVGKIVKVFEPVVKALHSFVDGEVASTEDGTPLMWINEEDGHYYPAVACLRSVIETYAKLGHVHGWANRNAGLTHVANLLERGEPIHKHDVDAALKTVEWMKYCTLTITPRQFTQEAVEVQIASELRDAKLAPELTDSDLTGVAE